MPEQTIARELQSSIDSLTGVIMRHGRTEKDRTFLGMATYLGSGNWAALTDQLFGARINGEFTGTQEIIDVWIHPVTGGEFPVKWGHVSIIKPLAILHAPRSGAQEVVYAHAAELAFPDYRKVWRNSFGGARVFSDLEFHTNEPTVAVECCIFDTPRFARWSVQRDDATPAVHAGMNYPGHKDAGGPIVDEGGRLAGMLLGPDYGSSDEHKGWYIPVDYIEPSVAICRAALPTSRQSIRGPVHYVAHRSNDVEFF
jgi:hypothetical protein